MAPPRIHVVACFLLHLVSSAPSQTRATLQDPHEPGHQQGHEAALQVAGAGFLVQDGTSPDERSIGLRRRLRSHGKPGEGASRPGGLMQPRGEGVAPIIGGLSRPGGLMQLTYHRVGKLDARAQRSKDRKRIEQHCRKREGAQAKKRKAEERVRGAWKGERASVKDPEGGRRHLAASSSPFLNSPPPALPRPPPSPLPPSPTLKSPPPSPPRLLPSPFPPPSTNLSSPPPFPKPPPSPLSPPSPTLKLPPPPSLLSFGLPPPLRPLLPPPSLKPPPPSPSLKSPSPRPLLFPTPLPSPAKPPLPPTPPAPPTPPSPKSPPPAMKPPPAHSPTPPPRGPTPVLMHPPYPPPKSPPPSPPPSSPPPIVLPPPVTPPTSPPPPPARQYPLQGSIIPSYFYSVTLLVGTSGPFTFGLDTGSDVSWLRCDAPCIACPAGPHPPFSPAGASLIDCTKPFCAEAQDVGAYHGCTVAGSRKCKYETPYTSGAHSVGYLISSNFSLTLSNAKTVRTQISFGCAFNQTGVLRSINSVDGLMGLNPQPLAVNHQIALVNGGDYSFGYCLGGTSGGFFFFGPPPPSLPAVAWVPMSTDGYLYYLDITAMGVGGKGVKIPSGLYTFIDSGTRFSYFVTPLYQSLLGLIKAAASSKGLIPKPSTVGNVCWLSPSNGTFSSLADATPFFPTWTITFGSAATISFSPENYIFIAAQDGACLGLGDGGDPNGGAMNVVGEITQRDFILAYDEYNGLLGWKRYSCSS